MLLTKEGVIDTVHKELTGRHSRMSKTWAEYINKTVEKINDKYAKDILLHLCKHNEEIWTPEELKNTLHIDLPIKSIHERLEQLLEADLIEDGKEMEIDIKAESDCKKVVLIEVKKWKTKVGVQIIRDFLEKIDVYASLNKNKKIIPAFLSMGGFSVHAKKLCQDKKIGIAETISL